MQPTPAPSLPSTMINFHQKYTLMKSYLSKKRFSYVYEQCMKFYQKNNMMFSNHQVLLLIKIVFYVLKKKMIAKYTSSDMISVEVMFQIFAMMRNVFLSWESVIMVQMVAEEPGFFDMLHRDKEYRSSKLIVTRPSQQLLFKPKPQYVVVKKIHLQNKAYNFFKQLLTMTINSLLAMVSSFEIGKLSQMVTAIKQAQRIMCHFQQHQFPIQKIQFYMIKCQIIQYVQNKTQLCLNLSVKYQFPLGLFQIIYSSLHKWKERKVLHYVKLLFKVVFVSLRNQLMTVEDAYVLGNQIRVLVVVIGMKENDKVKKGSILKGKERIVQRRKSQFSTDQEGNSNKPASKPQQLRNQHQLKAATKYLSLLKEIIHQIECYICERKQLQHIIRVYLSSAYITYKSITIEDQIIGQVPLLRERQLSKRQKQYNFQTQKSPTKVHQTESIKKLKLYSSGSKVDEQLMKSTVGWRSKEKEKEKEKQMEKQRKNANKFIMRNVMNVRTNRKKLVLENRNGSAIRQGMGLREGNVGDWKQKQKQKQGLSFESRNRFPYSQFITTLTQSTLQHCPTLHNSPLSPLTLLHQSSSDSQNQMQNQFQSKRRLQIQQLNSRYYKDSNPNYINGKKVETDKDVDQEWIETSNLVDDDRGKRLSDEIQFQQIKLLDHVIEKKVFALLNMENQQQISLKEKNQYTKRENTQSNSISNHNHSTSHSPQPITPYPQVLTKTSALLHQVSQLNRRRKLIIQKFSQKSKTLKTQTNSSSTQPQQQYSILKDLQNIYNTKNNLTRNAQNRVELYKRLIKIQHIEQSRFSAMISENSKISYNRDYKNNLSIIGEQFEDSQLLQRNQQLKITDYLVQNCPVSLLVQTIKHKQKKLKGEDNIKSKSKSKGESDKNQYDNQSKGEIVLRLQYDHLLTDISRNRFNQTNTLSKDFGLKSIQ